MTTTASLPTDPTQSLCANLLGHGRQGQPEEHESAHPLRLAEQLLRLTTLQPLFRSTDTAQGNRFAAALATRMTVAGAVRTLSGKALTIEQIPELEAWSNRHQPQPSPELLVALEQPKPCLIIRQAEALDGTLYAALHLQLIAPGYCTLVLIGNLTLEQLTGLCQLPAEARDNHIEIDLQPPSLPQEFLTRWWRERRLRRKIVANPPPEIAPQDYCY